MSFDGSPRSETVEYEPVGVKDLLIEMKDTSELVVDIAYSALLHNSEALAMEVLELESKMDVLQMQARMNTLLAARRPDEARRLAPVLGVIGAAEKVSEAAGDIAGIVLGEEELPGAIRAALPEAVEVLARAPVDSESVYVGRTLGDIDLETKTGVRVIAVRDDDEWNLNPDNETAVNTADVLLLRGSEEAVSEVYKRMTGEAYEPPPATTPEITELDRAVDTIVLLKNVSELSVDLAYGSVLFDDETLAGEVHSLEIEVDALQSRLEAWTLQAASEAEDPVALRGLLHLASSTELISDAALEITEGILRDIETHPVIAQSVRESDVAVRRAQVGAGSEFAETPLGELRSRFPGVAVIAVHRSDDQWVFYPDDETEVGGDDVLIARGTWNATEELLDGLQAA